MRLSDFTNALGDDAPAAPAADMLQSALDWAAAGWYVFPLRPGSKAPLLPRNRDCDKSCHGTCGKDGHGAWDGTVDPERIRRWWGNNPTAGIGGATVGRVVIDLDVQHGAPTDLPYPPTREHLSGRGNGNKHLIYRAVDGGLSERIRSGTNVLGPGVDIRAGGGSYVVLPPTPHEATGLPYRIADADVPEAGLTDDGVVALWTAAGAPVPGTDPRTRPRGRGGLRLAVDNSQQVADASPKRLHELLGSMPAEGGRNDWLTRLCGHLARVHRHDEPGYFALVRSIAANLPDPLPAREVERTAESVWNTDQTNHAPAEGVSADTGWLAGDGVHLTCQVRVNTPTGNVLEQADYGNFDLRALGVSTDDAGVRSMHVEVLRDGRSVTTVVPATQFGDDRATRKWLTGFGASAVAPPNAYPPMALGERLLRYLDAQAPRETRVVNHLGWDDQLGGFVTPDCVMTGATVEDLRDSGVSLAPSLGARNLFTHRYGRSADLAEARRVLREVLTFQEPETASVFGAWWAACFLRPQIQSEASLFPFMGLEATAESGKTTGFFDLMVQLNGNVRGQTAPTRAVLRDSMSANSSGIVWVDDMDDLDAYGELLRASTTSGVVAKMGADNTSVTAVKVVAPVLISGESLGLRSQKALADRSYVLDVKSPKGRRSLHGDYPQWDDVVDLMGKYPRAQGGLAVLSGHLLQVALTHRGVIVDCLREMRRDLRGRFGDRMAVIRAGARLLDELVAVDPTPWEGTGEHAQRVDAWVKAQLADHLDRDNSLTLKLVPWALRAWGFPTAPGASESMGRFSGVDTPVFVQEFGPEGLDGSGGTRVWVSTSLLADAWRREAGRGVSERTETSSALEQQAQALGASDQFHVIQGSTRRMRYFCLPARYSQAVLDRARG